MKVFNLRRSLSLGLLLFVAGCASIVKGRHQEVTFQSAPDGAVVVLNGRTLGKTPLTVTIPKKSGQTVVIEREGYKTMTFSLETRTSGWFWGNLVFGGLFGSTTDNVTGAVHEYSPSQYLVTLQTLKSNPISAAPEKSKEDRVRDFILVAYPNIISDLKIGKGAYLSSLLSLLDVSDEDTEAVVAQISQLAETSAGVLEFSRAVAELGAESSVD